MNEDLLEARAEMLALGAEPLAKSGNFSSYLFIDNTESGCREIYEPLDASYVLRNQIPLDKILK